MTMPAELESRGEEVVVYLFEIVMLVFAGKGSGKN
jgi:hypothetical protein